MSRLVLTLEYMYAMTFGDRATAVIVENGQLLTVRLPGQPGTVLPGGKVRGGEQVEDALRCT